MNIKQNSKSHFDEGLSQENSEKYGATSDKGGGSCEGWASGVIGGGEEKSEGRVLTRRGRAVELASPYKNRGEETEDTAFCSGKVYESGGVYPYDEPLEGPDLTVGAAGYHLARGYQSAWDTYLEEWEDSSFGESVDSLEEALAWIDQRQG